MKKLLMCVGLCAIIYQTGCKAHKEEKEEAVKYEVTSPVAVDTTVTKEYVAQIRSSRHIEVRSQEHGYIEKILVDEGKPVKQGQLLFQVMTTVYQADLQKAQAEAKLIEIEYQNTARLAQNNIVAPNELAMAKAKLDKAKAEVALAQAHLGFTSVKAPFDGIVDRLQVRLGSLVEEGDLLTNLSDNSKMWVYFNVPEAEYLDYKSRVKQDSAMTVHLLMANNQLFPYKGKVETIEADFNNETGNIAFRATFPNPDGLLRHGETGNIQIKVPVRNAVLIPQKTTFEVLDKKYVYVLDKDNRLQSREIEIAAELPHIFVVRKGLSPKDKILLEGLRLVREKQKIDYTFQEPRKVLNNLGLYAE